MTDNLSKADLNARLATPLTASALKKIAKADLVAMVAAQEKPRQPRTLKPHVFCQPVADATEAKALKEGSKKHLLAAALLNGATLDELMAVTGWNKSTVQSAFAYDMKSAGLGVERREDGRYYLLLPAGMLRLPIATADVTRADALVAACR
ncbi:hypothetical protein [Rhodobaculum claviforme]|uniref:DUF3489 domain-containing protein n=1 Tax=Rhodobaculum claviforme TaxID=1549854 RepID=A0A934TMT3_9RHOB|nr:hypothetical protein [Rhodobaculum claviforme]MBK5928361.1 hypothetical protein [Rhodobaculum claviforme]